MNHLQALATFGGVALLYGGCVTKMSDVRTFCLESVNEQKADLTARADGDGNLRVQVSEFNTFRDNSVAVIIPGDLAEDDSMNVNINALDLTQIDYSQRDSMNVFEQFNDDNDYLWGGIGSYAAGTAIALDVVVLDGYFSGIELK